MTFIMKFINIAPVLVYIRGGGHRVGWVVAKAKQRRKKTQIVEFRVAVMYTCTHKGLIFHYKT